MNNSGFNDVRLFYSKTGSAKYISHLDVMRAFQRTFKRSRIPVWYTEGFHPHLYLTFALPLSLGYEGLCESVDFRVMGEPIPYEQLVARLNASFPVGFCALSAAMPVMGPAEIETAVYDVSFSVESAAPEAVLAAWEACFSAAEITVLKHTKRGDRPVDIKPLIDLEPMTYRDGRFSLSMRLPAGTESNINPSLVFSAFSSSSGLEAGEISVVRRAILTKSGENFR